ncbi:MAG: hypothetical protein M1816_000927 [Peltula sp. TS41687]|nr:MAG: hypothetical protein M1816_000927 [Peltula sp. TS41687]
MSDEDNDFMQESDQEEYDFEYEDDDNQETGDVGVENKYYNAKQLKASDPQEAIAEFLEIPGLEEEKGDWGFKGLKQAIKLEYKLKQYAKAVEHYCELLTYVKSAVTRNYSEKSINTMLSYIEKGADDTSARDCVESFYSKTLESFQSTNNERLWLKTNIRMARLWLEHKEYQRLTKKFRELHRACEKEDGTDDPSKGTYSLEIYSLEIQMYSEMKNNNRLKSLYQRALLVRSAVPHPKVMGIIRECGGKMHMSEENWKEAQSDFFESFRNYDEAGSLQRIQVLKYLVLTTMLMKSDINPFDSQETKPYKNDPRIAVMNDLVDAYQHDDLERYQSILDGNPDVLADSFIAENIDEVTRNIRTKTMMRLVAPYSSFRLCFVAEKLQISEEEAEDILCSLITDGKLHAKIYQPQGTVLVESEQERDEAARWARIREWMEALEGLWTRVLEDGEGFRAIDYTSISQYGPPGPEELLGGGGSGGGKLFGPSAGARKPGRPLRGGHK